MFARCVCTFMYPTQRAQFFADGGLCDGKWPIASTASRRSAPFLFTSSYRRSELPYRRWGRAAAELW